MKRVFHLSSSSDSDHEESTTATSSSKEYSADEDDSDDQIGSINSLSEDEKPLRIYEPMDLTDIAKMFKASQGSIYFPPPEVLFYNMGTIMAYSNLSLIQPRSDIEIARDPQGNDQVWIDENVNLISLLREGGVLASKQRKNNDNHYRYKILDEEHSVWTIEKMFLEDNFSWNFPHMIFMKIKFFEKLYFYKATFCYNRTLTGFILNKLFRNFMHEMREEWNGNYLHYDKTDDSYIVNNIRLLYHGRQMKRVLESRACGTFSLEFKDVCKAKQIEGVSFQQQSVCEQMHNFLPEELCHHVMSFVDWDSWFFNFHRYENNRKSDQTKLFKDIFWFVTSRYTLNYYTISTHYLYLFGSRIPNHLMLTLWSSEKDHTTHASKLNLKRVMTTTRRMFAYERM